MTQATAPTTQLRHVTAGRTHKDTAAATLQALNDVITTQARPEHLLIVLDTDPEGIHYGLHLQPYSLSTYSAFPASLRPEHDRPRGLGRSDQPLGVMLHLHTRTSDPREDIAHNLNALALAARRFKRLHPTGAAFTAHGTTPARPVRRVVSPGIVLAP